MVAQITGVRVRETVPDSILDRADAIELVDLTPDDLIQRLKEGKVYVPKQAERALEHFFSPANLTALRELALRRTAERVDEQLLDEMQARAISGSVARGRTPARLRQRRPARGGSRALHQAPRRPAASDPGRRSTSRPSAACNCPRRSATASPTRFGWRRPWVESRSPFPAATAASPTTWSALRKRTTSPRSSSANPRGRPGSSFCTARWSAISFAAAAISACTSSPARTWTRRPSRERRFAPPNGRSLSILGPIGSRCSPWPWPLA